MHMCTVYSRHVLIEQHLCNSGLYLCHSGLYLCNSGPYPCVTAVYLSDSGLYFLCNSNLCLLQWAVPA